MRHRLEHELCENNVKCGMLSVIIIGFPLFSTNGNIGGLHYREFIIFHVSSFKIFMSSNSLTGASEGLDES